MRNPRQWSGKDLEECKRDYPTTEAKVLAERFGVTKGAMQAFLSYYNIRGKAKPRKKKRKNKRWTITDVRFIQDNYPTMTRAKPADHFGVSDYSMESYLRRHGFRKYKKNKQ